MQVNTATDILKKYWGYDQFRPLQEDIINHVLANKDTLALLPTGGGKSLCYQVPGMVRKGLCLVISPLIALMQDQVQSLLQKNIPAALLFSGMSREAGDEVINAAINHKLKFLYVSPERLQSNVFLQAFRQMPVSLVAIDEAHCISQWGFDFRPEYLKIHELRNITGSIPFLALTATATATVIADIEKYLQLRKPQLFRQSFERSNLSFYLLNTEDKKRKLLQAIHKLEGCGIVYVKNRKSTSDLCTYLEQQEISAAYYHGGMKADERLKAQQQWIQNEKRVMVATNAFGMGIDKPDVRFVIHYDISESPEAYYQEAGRAGRDGAESRCIVLYQAADKKKMLELFAAAYPDEQEVKKMMQRLYMHLNIPAGSGENTFYPFDLDSFSEKFGIKVFHAYQCLKHLEKQGLIKLSEGVGNPSRLRINATMADISALENIRPDWVELLHLLIRSYAEIFSEYAYINEQLLAKRSGLAQEKIQAMLMAMVRENIVHYIPESTRTGITLLISRTQGIPFDSKRYHFLKDNHYRKLSAMISYAENDTICRNRLLLQYFDETNTKDCGKCDVCRRSLGEDQLTGRIKKFLDQPRTLEELIDLIGTEYRNQVTEVLRWLIDEDAVIRNGEGKFLKA